MNRRMEEDLIWADTEICKVQTRKLTTGWLAVNCMMERRPIVMPLNIARGHFIEKKCTKYW